MGASEDNAAWAAIGQTLRAAREAERLTVADVAARTKFSVRQVESLEAGDTAHLPQGAFLRGFVRSYARMLHLDESADLLATLPQQNVAHGDVSEVQAGGVEFPRTQSTNRKNAYLLGGALGVACLLAIFVWLHQGQPVQQQVVMDEVKLPEMQTASAVAPAASAVVVMSAVQAPPAVVPAPKPVQSVSVEAPKPVVKALASAAAKPVPPPVVDPASKTEIALEQLRKRPIHIVFLEESWMEIKDRNDEVLLSRTNPAGSEKWIGGGKRAPYEVSIGKAGAVRIYYYGKEVDLSHFNQDSIANFVLE